GADGRYQGVAALDLEPGGLNACVLKLPAGCRLVHASVERLPALIDPLGQGRWRLALGPQQLPQHIELIYSGSVAGSGVQKQFQAPRLADIGVDQTLWTIYGPPSMGDAEPRQSTWHVHAVQQQLTRLQNVAALVTLPPEVVGEHLPEEIARWYGSWQNRYAAGRAALRRQALV